MTVARRGQYSSTNIVSIPLSLSLKHAHACTQKSSCKTMQMPTYFKSLQQQCDLGGLTSVKCSVYEVMGIAKKKLRCLVQQHECIPFVDFPEGFSKPQLSPSFLKSPNWNAEELTTNSPQTEQWRGLPKWQRPRRSCQHWLQEMQTLHHLQPGFSTPDFVPATQRNCF